MEEKTKPEVVTSVPRLWKTQEHHYTSHQNKMVHVAAGLWIDGPDGKGKYHVVLTADGTAPFAERQSSAWRESEYVLVDDADLVSRVLAARREQIERKKHDKQPLKQRQQPTQRCTTRCVLKGRL